MGSTNKVWCQKETNIWYYGQAAGLDFNSGKPVALNNSAMLANFGCASIADSSGHLLFYSNGENIWNRKHAVLSNGAGLKGNNTATQAAVFVKQPGNDSLYYLFTNDNSSSTSRYGLRYHIINLKLNGGYGDVILKNQVLNTSSSEKLAVSRHANGTDLWIVAHDADSNIFNVYLLSDAGIYTRPVASHQGATYGRKDYGCMTISIDGTKLATAIPGQKLTEVFDFDNSAGAVRLAYSMADTIPYIGLSFSPDNKMLYLGSSYNTGALVQYDLNNTNPYKIVGTSIVLAKKTLGTLQIGPDKKIYVAEPGLDSLLVINSPNNKSIASNITQINAMNKSSLGLPNVMNSYLRDIDFNYIATCSADSVKFNLLSSPPDSLVWDFGESGSKTNTSRRRNPSHVYKTGGNYTVVLITYQKGNIITLSKTFTLLSAPKALDTTEYICPGQGTTLNAIQPGYSYQWQDNSKNGQLLVSTGAKYWVKLSTKACHVTDTFRVIALPKPKQYNWKDTVVCNVDSFIMDVKQPLVNYFWQDSSTKPRLIAKKSGNYSVNISNQCGISYNSRKVTLLNKPHPYTWQDTIICKGAIITLDASQPNANFFWQDSSSDPTHTVYKSGTYIVKASNACGIVTGTMNVTVIDPVYPMGLRDTFICDGDEIVLRHLKQPGTTLEWQDSTNDSIKTISKGGYYKVTIKNACSSRSESFYAYRDDCTLYMQMPNAFSPDTNKLNDSYKAVINRKPRQFELHIFNRWGEEVFGTTDYKQGWDGKVNGQPAPEEVYIYAVKANGYHHENIYYHGIIHLVRDKTK